MCAKKWRAPVRERLRAHNGKSSAHALCNGAPHSTAGGNLSIERTTLLFLCGLVGGLGRFSISLSVMNYFYFDQTNQKRGPVSESQLRELAAKGLIGTHTPMETDTGHKGVAGQIPGLFSTQGTASSPKQVFCTNCASPVAENAVGCMSCGLKPTGHKKFCRQCGAARNPEQIVCTQCGANLASSILSDPTKIAGALSSGVIKKLTVGGIVIALVVGVIWFLLPLFPTMNLFGGGNDWRVIIKNAKPGDLARYDVTVVHGINTKKGQIALEVISNDGKTVRLRRTFRAPGTLPFRADTEHIETISIDLTQSEEEMRRQMLHLSEEALPGEIKDAKIVIERGKRDRETLSVANQQFHCVVASDTVVVSFGSITMRIPVVEWTSKTAPIFGTVKSEMTMTVPDVGIVHITTTLTEFYKMR